MTDQTLQDVKNHDLAGSLVHLWVFKRSITNNKFTAHYVRTDDALDNALRKFAHQLRDKLSECKPYSHLSEPTGNGCLWVASNDTNFAALKELVDRPETEHVVKDLKSLQGAAGYLVKFVKDGQVLYATRRSPSTWKTAFKSKGVLNTIFKDGMLSAVTDVDFTIEPGFDLLALKDVLLIANKRGFESMMQYRDGYVQAFSMLAKEPSFVSLFTTVAPLVKHVGGNGTHLRRMAVIQEKNLFTDAKYLPALKAVSEKNKWDIEFDATGKIVPTTETMSVILTLLLDHRLVSEITQIMYDVPDAFKVGTKKAKSPAVKAPKAAKAKSPKAPKKVAAKKKAV